MAREKKPPIDPDAFIEGMRRRSVPGYQRAVEAKTNDPPEVMDDESPAHGGMATESEEHLHPNPDTNDCGSRITEAETAFIRKFMDREGFRQVNRNGVHVFISRKHHEMINDLKGLLKSSVSISTYVDNVLAEHFEKYYPLIEGIESRSPRKFPKR